MGGSLVPSAEGLTEMRAAASARAPAKPGASAQSTQRRQRLKELLVTQLSKQFGATADPNLRAIIRAEAERALAKGRVSPEDIRELERNIRKTINLATSGTFDGSKPPVDAGHASERIDWGVLYEYKKVHGDEAERARLQRERDARVLLNSQIRHQIAERDAARRAALADEAAYAASEAAALARGRAEDSAKVARHKALVESERALNAEHVRLVEKKRQDEAHLSRLEDERMLAEMRSADAIAREERKRRAVEKAKRLEFARLADERSVRLKLEQREREDAEQRRLDAVWKGMLDEQERKREEGLKRIFEQQTVRQEAYGKSAGAEMAERAMRDEMNMLRWQTTYAQQQEERERRDKQKFDDTQRDIVTSLTAQMALAKRRQADEKAEDERQAAMAAANLRMSKQVESRLREEARRQAIAHQGELAVHARLVRQSQLEGALNENFMSASDKMYNSNLVRAVLDFQTSGKLSDVHTPLG